jgi:hypothetical protein
MTQQGRTQQGKARQGQGRQGRQDKSGQPQSGQPQSGQPQSGQRQSGQPQSDRYDADLERLQNLLDECERLAERCHGFADEAVIPNAGTLFRTLAYASDAQAQALEAVIEQAHDLDRSGHLSEFLSAYEHALEAGPNGETEGDTAGDMADEPNRGWEGREVRGEPSSEAHESEGSASKQQPRGTAARGRRRRI